MFHHLLTTPDILFPSSLEGKSSLTPVRKFPVFYGTQRFSIMFIRACH
jgi:hypothetical protein